MATQIQFRRGTKTEHNSFTGATAEVTVNTTNISLHVHDGITAGGVEVARADLSNHSGVGVLTATTFSGNLTGEVNATSFDTNSSGVIVTGVTTSTSGFVGNLTGEVNATSFDTNSSGVIVTGVTTSTSGFVGNLTGDVTGNINSSGVSTFSNVVVGGATTELIVVGDTKITGILTVGSSSITIDGNNNQVNVGAGVTIHHIDGIQVGGNKIHSSGLTINQINVSGVSTFSSETGIGTVNIGFGNTALFVDGDTRIAGILTIGTSSITLNGIDNTIKIGTGLTLTESGSANYAGIVTALGFSGNLTGEVNSASFDTNPSGVVVTGVTTSTSGFVGNLTGNVTGNADTATILQTSRTFEITGDIVASAISFNGSGNVSLAATIQPNSVGLGTDTTGDYVQSITGTANQITVTSGTGEGSTPTLSVPNQFTAPQDVTVTRDLQINRNLNVNGNITIGGTSATLFTTEFKVYDPDIVLGFRTDGSGNDISNDNTANHGGIAIASTEGTPLINLYDVGIGETNPSTYKKIMWFKSGTFSGLGTDAWISNYAIGIGSTQVPNGVRLAAGGMQVTDTSLSVPRLNISGLSTFTNGPVLVGTSSSTGTSSQRLQVTGGAYVSGNVGIGTTNPQYTLDVAGDINFNGSLNQNGSTFVASRWTSGIGNDIYRLNGNVGIGTTNPTTELQIIGNANISGIVTASSFSGPLTGNVTGTATSTTNIPNLTGDVTSVNTLTTLATVNSNVGTFGSGGAIPTITVNAKGLVTGVTTTAVNPANDGILTLNTSGTGLSGSTTFSANQVGNTTFTVTSNATNANTGSTLVARDGGGGFVAGIITATDFNSTSDFNLKDNIQTLENALDVVKNIRGVKFEWKENHKQSVGVIAQEVEKVLPQLVTTSETKTVNYNGLVGVLIESVKELKLENDLLKLEISKIKSHLQIDL